MLGKIKQNISTLTNYLYINKDTKFYAYRPYIEQLHNRIHDASVSESTDDNLYTSYSINKGEQLVFCIRSRETKNKMHDINLIMYVVLHEMAHVACPEYGHTQLFKKIFAFLTEEAIAIGIYKKIDFSSTPTEYCGLIISDSII